MEELICHSKTATKSSTVSATSVALKIPVFGNGRTADLASTFTATISLSIETGCTTFQIPGPKIARVPLVLRRRRRGNKRRTERTDMPVEARNGYNYHICHFCGAKDAGDQAWTSGGHCPSFHLGWVYHYPDPLTQDYACPACASKAKTWEQAKAAAEKRDGPPPSKRKKPCANTR